MFCNGPWMSDRNFDLIMPKDFDSYHPYVCNCCKRGPLQNIDLFRCSSCKVTKYCSRDHQRKDWPDHKLWCKSFVKVMNKEDESELVPKGQEEDIDSWRRRMMTITEKIMSNMCRLAGGVGVGTHIASDMMHTNHIQVAMLQPSCHKCLRTGRPRRVRQDDDDDGGVELIVCPHCSGVAVCKRCLGDQKGVMEWSCFHDTEQECKKHLIALCCSGMIVENSNLLLVTSDTNIEKGTIFQPKDWNEYFHEKGADFDVGAEMPISLLRKMPPISAFLTDGLTFPLTIQHILGRNNLSILNNNSNKSTTKDKLCIHVLGAAASEYSYQRSST
jgi:hypothetical protein